MKGRTPRFKTWLSAAAPSGELEGYLAEIASQLHVEPATEKDIIAEVRSHLEETIAELRADGLGTEESTAVAVDDFGPARQVGRMLDGAHGDPLWIKVGLAILPGLFPLASASGLLSALFGARAGEVVSNTGLTGVCLLVITAGFVRERHFAVWSYPAVGVLLFRMWWGIPWPSSEQSGSYWTVAPPLLMLAGLAAIAAVGVYQAHKWQRLHSYRPGWALLGLIILVAVAFPAGAVLAYRDAERVSVLLAMVPLSLWWMGMLLLPVVIGLPLALRSGLSTGLLVVAAQYVLSEQIFDPARGVLIFTSDYVAARLLSSLPALAFLIVPPVWILLIRRTKVRFWGLVLPPLLGLLSLSLIRAGVLQGTVAEYEVGSWLTDFLAGAQLVFLFALTGLIYHRLGPQGAASTESFNSTASGSMSLGCLADERRA